MGACPIPTIVWILFFQFVLYLGENQTWKNCEKWNYTINHVRLSNTLMGCKDNDINFTSFVTLLGILLWGVQNDCQLMKRTFCLWKKRKNSKVYINIDLAKLNRGQPSFTQYFLGLNYMHSYLSNLLVKITYLSNLCWPNHLVCENKNLHISGWIRPFWASLDFFWQKNIFCYGNLVSP